MGHKNLYLKYRPSNFSDVVGQDLTVKTLLNGLLSNTLGHAFIFSGIRGTGKTTLARILAKSFNCETLNNADFSNNLNNTTNNIESRIANETNIPCEKCPSCISRNNIDIIEMDAASNTGIDDIRKVIEGAQYKPATSKYKIFIVDEVHMISKSAFNALLKTLEEPPEHVKFIFATTEIEKVPATILSRCMEFTLNRIEDKKIVEQLSKICLAENREFETKALQIIAKYSTGSLRDGLSILDQAILMSDGEKITEKVVGSMLLVNTSYNISIFNCILESNLDNMLSLFEKIQNIDSFNLIQDIISMFYKSVKIKANQILNKEKN
jgi:DNA polymerase III subunit gamma/tau